MEHKELWHRMYRTELYSQQLGMFSRKSNVLKILKRLERIIQKSTSAHFSDVCCAYCAWEVSSCGRTERLQRLDQHAAQTCSRNPASSMYNADREFKFTESELTSTAVVRKWDLAKNRRAKRRKAKELEWLSSGENEKER